MSNKMTTGRGREIVRRFVLASVVVMVVVSVGYVAWTYRTEANMHGIPVLMYHELVGSADRVGRYSLHVDHFAQHMEYLAMAGYTPITDRDLIAAREGVNALPDRPIIITFDDGTVDHKVLAEGVLNTHGFKAVFFIVSERVGHPGSLSPEQLQQMAQSGMSIQSHGHTHRFLDLLGPEELQEEIAESRAIIAKATGVDVVSLCIPGGWYNSVVLDAARDVGYRLVFTSDIGVNSAEGDTFVLKRLEIRGGTDGGAFEQQLMPAAITRNKLIRRAKLVLHAIRGRKQE